VGLQSCQQRDPVIDYVALPPGVVTAALEAIRASSLPRGSQIALENPFGHDADSASALNNLLVQAGAPAGEDAVYRVDHLLGMPLLHNLLAMRTSNRTLREVWSAEHITEIACCGRKHSPSRVAPRSTTARARSRT
jgi:glucose-6-phosphate 1-dehydrogenase